MDKVKRVIARWCIKLLTIDSIRTWFVVNVLREIDIDDIIKVLRTNEPAVIKCPKCGCEIAKK
jgi:hypothetical protein